MKNLIFFDWDDTVYDSKNQVLPEENKQVLKELKENEEVLIGIASGRAAFYFKNFDIDWDIYVTNNGQYAKVNETIIYENKVKDEFKNELIDWAKKHGGSVISIHSELGVQHSNRPTQRSILEHDSYHRIQVYGPHQENLPYAHILIMAYDPKYDGELEHIYPNYIFHRYNGYMVDVIPKGLTKFDAIIKVADYLKVKHEDIIAFGDGMNDLEMIEGVGIGIAMGNAEDALKEKAKLITDRYDQAGLRKALVQLKLLKGEQ